MKLVMTLIKANEQQFNELMPLTDHSKMIETLHKFELENKDLDTEEPGIFLGYFILNEVFNIMTVPNAQHMGDALTHAMNDVVLKEINKYYKPKLPKLKKLDTALNVAKGETK